MRKRSTRFLAAVLLAGSFLFAQCGDDDGDDGSANLTGTATRPDSVGGGPAANAPFIVVDLARPAETQQVAAGTTDGAGNFAASVGKTPSVAVIITATASSGEAVRVSGILRARSSAIKSLNGQTDIACEAGVTAVQDGTLTAEQLDATRIANLENAAARFVGTTDFKSPASVSAAAAQVRVLTQNGAVPAPPA